MRLTFNWRKFSTVHLKLVDLSHSIEDGMKAYPGFPSPKIGAYFTHADSAPRYENKSSFYIGKVEMVYNVGTYMDSPFHRYENGKDLSQIPLEKIASLPGIVIDGAPEGREINLDSNENLEGKAALIRTGWDVRWGSEGYWEPGPFLSEESVDLLMKSKPSLVGVDFWNIDDVANLSRPAHTKLLAAETPIVEHLCSLSSLPSRGFKFWAVPPKIVKGASFPVRAFAEF